MKQSLKIHAMSDLHLEFGDIRLPGGDVLVLAGDIWLSDKMQEHKTDDRSRSLRKRFARFAEEEMAKYRHVLMVLGNHEHYGCLFERSAPIVREFLSKVAPNAILLDNAAVIIEGVAFIGSTMWAKYGAGDVLEEMRVRNSMNDCVAIKTLRLPEGGWGRTPYERNMLPSDFEKVHKTSRKRTHILLMEHSALPCVLITHHAATLAAGKTDPHWGRGLDEAYYSNFLDYAVRNNKNIVAAIHGHTHNRVRFDHHGVLVVSNPRGYAGCESVADDFDQDYGTFEISREGKVVE